MQFLMTPKFLKTECSVFAPLNTGNIVYLTQFIGYDPDKKVHTYIVFFYKSCIDATL